MEQATTLPGIELHPPPAASRPPAAQEDLRGRQRRYMPIDRTQSVMHPVDIEHLLPEDDPARAIWELVGELDLSVYEEQIRAVEERAGRPAYNPQLMASLLILAYTQGITSAREIERLCHYHPQYMWLTACQPVNYTSLCEFRRINPEAQREMFAEVLGIMADKGLVTLERVFQDGTKVQACASADTFRSGEKIEAKIAEARQVLEALEEQAQQEGGEKPSPQRVAAVQRQLEKRELAREELKKLQAVKAKRKQEQSAKVSVTDPEVRMMKKRHGGYEPSLNAQLVSDAKCGAVVAAFVTQSSSDAESLIEGVKQTEQNTGRKPEQVVADGGYATNANAAETKQMGVELYSPPGDSAARSAAACKRWNIEEGFRPEAFQHRAQENVLVCPAGKILEFRKRSEDEQSGEVRYSYQANAADCQACEFKSQCCPLTKGGRSVSRAELPPAMAELKARMETAEAQAIYKQRKQAELPNAWLKSQLGLRQFRLQGLIKGGMELLWACMACNVRILLRFRGAVLPAPPG